VRPLNNKKRTSLINNFNTQIMKTLLTLGIICLIVAAYYCKINKQKQIKSMQDKKRAALRARIGV